MSAFNYRDFDPEIDNKFSPTFFANAKRLAVSSIWENLRVVQDPHGELWCGVIYEGHFMGSLLMNWFSDTCLHTAIGLSFIYLSNDLQEVTTFWDEYKALGCCILDREHVAKFRNGVYRYKYKGSMRICNWCGAEQQLVQKQKLVEQVTWELVNQTQKEGA